MAGDGMKWDGLLKWSLAHSDGTQLPRTLSEEDRRWFMEAMQAQTVDVVKRMKEITLVMKTPEDVLESQGVTPANIEDIAMDVTFLSTMILSALSLFSFGFPDMLDELQEHVESIDMANDLHSIGGLVPLLGYLKNPNAGIRSKAADVVTTIVQNNPRSQQLVMEAGGLEPLLSNFTVDPDVTVRTKALGAISSLIRNNKPGILAFRLANGYAALRDALGSENARFQRKALNLIQYLLHESDADCSIATELGFPRLMMHLASSEDSTVREAALGGLLELAKGRTSGGSTAIAEEDKLKQVLKDRIEGISSMSRDDLGAAKEERQLVDTLWNTCFDEPSSLREKGLVVLPGEDASEPAPDVAGKLFEPPLRALAANSSASDGDSGTSREKKQQSPLLLGPGPGFSNFDTQSNNE